MRNSQRILVVGSGAIGGTVAGRLLAQGCDVSVVSPNTEIARAVALNGFRLEGVHGSLTVRAKGRIHTTYETVAEEPFDVIFLATPPTGVEDAARSTADLLAPNGRVVCLQNGLCEMRVAHVVGQERTLGAVVAWGASMPEPGLFVQTAKGGFTLGALNGARDESVERIRRLLDPVGQVEVTQNLIGKRWSKLAINCAISSLGTIAKSRLGDLLKHAFVRRIALEIMTEAVTVAEREHIRLEPVAGTLNLSRVALCRDEKRVPLLFKHALVYAVGFKFRNMRSSMLAAIERGRPPSIDFLNGEVTKRGHLHGVPVPMNEAIVRLVWAVARKEQTPGFALLQKLFKESRSPNFGVPAHVDSRADSPEGTRTPNRGELTPPT